MSQCARETCCDETTDQQATSACWNVGACGCKVVPHPAHASVHFPPAQRTPTGGAL